MTWKCKNWEKWQTYRKDREQPPWIKLHRRLMRDHDWAEMTDAERGQLVCIWLLAADDDGKIPDRPEFIQKLCYMTNPPDLKAFEQKGFLIRAAAATPPRRRADAATTTQSRVEESRVEKKRVEKRGGRFAPPTPQEVAAYGKEIGFAVDGDQFCDFYASKGWLIGKNPMKDWKAAVRTWKRRRGEDEARHKVADLAVRAKQMAEVD